MAEATMTPTPTPAQSILLRNSASGIELTPEPRGITKKSRLGSVSKGDTTAGASDNRSARKIAPVSAGKESFEWDPTAWKKQKKPRSLLIDESKLLHDYNKKSVNCTLCRKSITSSQLRQVQSFYQTSGLYLLILLHHFSIFSPALYPGFLQYIHIRPSLSSL